MVNDMEQRESAEGRRAAYRLGLAALAGLVFGLGLSLGTNVPGLVLAVYGTVLAVLLVAGAIAVRRTARRSRGGPRGRAR
jgi:hypothetical protein